MTKLVSRLPKGISNGLPAIGEYLLANKGQVIVGIVIMDWDKIIEHSDTGDFEPLVRIRRIEGIRDPQDGARLRQLLVREYERRTGKTVLPLDMEDDIRSAFGTPDDEE